MLKRRVGSVFVVIGAVLIISALLLFLYNEKESETAGEAASAALSALQEAMGESEPEHPTESGDAALNATTAPTEVIETTEPIPEPTGLTYVNFEGYYYIGYLSIPRFELELPIMGDWSMAQLQIAPCLQYGSPLDDDAVIAGHNFKHHFLSLHDIDVGDAVDFVDMSGYVIAYEVTEVKIIPPTNVDEVINSEHDLILYTCTIGGKSRFMVGCDRIEMDAE